jgi:hypothetical protein
MKPKNRSVFLGGRVFSILAHKVSNYSGCSNDKNVPPLRIPFDSILLCIRILLSSSGTSAEEKKTANKSYLAGGLEETTA